MLMYMIRHGESESNRGRFYGGWSPVRLTAEGEEQAKLAGKRLAALPIERVIASDLKRAIQTCELALPGRVYETSELIREINVGDLAGRSVEECERAYGPRFFMDRKVRDYTAYRGENRAMVKARVERFLRQAEQYPQNLVAVFTHEGVMTAALELVLNAAPGRDAARCDNGSFAVFEYLDGIWRLNGWNV